MLRVGPFVTLSKALSRSGSSLLLDAQTVKSSCFLLHSSFNGSINHQQQHKRSLMYLVNPRNLKEIQEADEEEFEGEYIDLDIYQI